jgi:ABC-type polar amino acid transport system ATPase subunit
MIQFQTVVKTFRRARVLDGISLDIDTDQARPDRQAS